MAVANSLAAVSAGARQIECTINGIGERAGNCSLEEIVMALKTRDEFFELETALTPRASTRHHAWSRALPACRYPGTKRSLAKTHSPMRQAFISTACCSTRRPTKSCGQTTSVSVSSNLVLGKHSGRHAFRDRVAELGFELDDFEVNRAFQEFKKLADKKKDVYDGDIEAIIMNVDGLLPVPGHLKRLEVQTSYRSAGDCRP